MDEWITGDLNGYNDRIHAGTVDTEQKSGKTELLRMSLLLIRPFHIIHQWMVIFLAVSIKGLLSSVSPLTLLLLWTQTFLVMPLLFIINDLLHADDDKKMGKKRLFTSTNFSARGAISVAVLIFVTISLLSLLRSTYNFLFYLQLFVTASLYGYFKHKRRTGLTYVFRTLSGFSLYLFVASYFGLYGVDIYMAAFVGLSDLSGHIVGDVRDFIKDKEARVMTLPVIMGIRRTNVVVLAAQMVTLLILAVSTMVPRDIVLIRQGVMRNSQVIPLGTVQVIMVLYAVSWALYLFLLRREEKNYNWVHACFHGSKVLSFLFTGMVTAGIPVAEELGIGAIVLVTWYVLYRTYLWADHRLSFFPKRFRL